MNLNEIISDLNVTIVDIETLNGENPNDLNLKRCLGQLRAARASLLAFRSLLPKEVMK